MILCNRLVPSQEEQRELFSALRRVIQSGNYLLGRELSLFEKEFARFIGVPHTIGVGSGTDALMFALRALQLQDSEVIVPANAYPTAFGVANAGVHMKLCDVDPKTLVASVKTIEQALSKKTKAIVIVHLYGLPALMEEIMKFAKLHKLLVIEDCAQAVGAHRNGRSVGTFGDVGCFSFYPTKNLGAMGDGGMVVTKKKGVAEKIRQLRVYGEDKRYHSLEVSHNSRLDEIQCAILRVRLRHIVRSLYQRKILADEYRQSFPKELLVPKAIHRNIHHANHLFVLRTLHRDQLRRYLLNKRIEAMIHYPAPIHLQPAFSYLGYQKGDFPVSEQACEQVLSLPFYVGLKKIHQQLVIDAVNEFSERYGIN